jgi:hypothetical protein
MLNYLRNIDWRDKLSKMFVLILKMQIYWTFAFIICKFSFGTAYCAPSWLRVFSNEKQPTVLDAIQSPDLSWSKLILVAVAGYCLYKGAELSFNFMSNAAYSAYESCYVEITGRPLQKALTTNEKINVLYQRVNELSQQNEYYVQSLTQIQIGLQRIQDRQIEGFNTVFEDLANMQTGGLHIGRHLRTLQRNLEDLNFTMQQTGVTSHQPQENPEIANLVARMEEVRQAVLNVQTRNNDGLDQIVGRLETMVENLGTDSRESVLQATDELRANITLIRTFIAESAQTVNNPIIREEIVMPQTQIVERTTADTLGAPRAYRQREEEIPIHRVAPHRMEPDQNITINTPNVRTTGSGLSVINPANNTLTNHINIVGMQPGRYALEITNQGGIHIDPLTMVGNAIQQTSDTPSTAGRIISTIGSIAANPEAQTTMITLGSRFINTYMSSPGRQQIPQPMPQTPMYYQPTPQNMQMVPYGYMPGFVQQPMQNAQRPTEMFAELGGLAGEGLGRIIGKTAGRFFKAISTAF